jgi:hypothetical protein
MVGYAAHGIPPDALDADPWLACDLAMIESYIFEIIIFCGGLGRTGVAA